MSRYPDGPGVRPGSAPGAYAAADFMASHAGGMCADVLALIREKPATPEELTERLQEGREGRVLLTTVRARVCQLRAQGFICDSGRRGLGESGKVKVAVWRAMTELERAAFLAEREAEASQRRDAA